MGDSDSSDRGALGKAVSSAAATAGAGVVLGAASMGLPMNGAAHPATQSPNNVQGSATSALEAFQELGDEWAQDQQRAAERRDSLEMDLSPEASNVGDPPEGWVDDMAWDLDEGAAHDAPAEASPELSDLLAAEHAEEAGEIGSAEPSELDALGAESEAAGDLGSEADFGDGAEAGGPADSGPGAF